MEIKITIEDIEDIEDVEYFSDDDLEFDVGPMDPEDYFNPNDEGSDDDFDFDDEDELAFTVYDINEAKLAIEHKLSDEDLAGSTYYIVDIDISRVMKKKYMLSLEMKNGKSYGNCMYYFKVQRMNRVLDEFKYHPTYLTTLFEQHGDDAFAQLGY